MTAVCELNSTLKDAVSGFLRGQFTRTVFMSIRDDITRATRKEEVTLVILADFSEAFDTVQYKLLITKPDLIGLSKSLLSWLTSYLLDHSQYVQIDETAPILISVQFSVPQGSILGSMLFIFHFSDLQDNLPANFSMLMIQLFMPAAILMTPLKKLKISTVCSMPTVLVYWFSRSTHPIETKIVVPSTSQMSRFHSLAQFNPSLRIPNRSLEHGNLTKLLGIHFSEHISWKEYVHKLSVAKSCYSVLGILRKIKNFTRNTYLTITLAKLKLSPVRFRTEWVTRCEYCRERACFFFFLLFFFPYCANWHALWRNINKLACEVRRADHCSFISIFLWLVF